LLAEPEDQRYLLKRWPRIESTLVRCSFQATHVQEYDITTS